MKIDYICSACGYRSPKWLGRCTMCNEWNTMEECPREEAPAVKSPKQKNISSFGIAASSTARPISKIEFSGDTRFSTGIGEFDRVLGGGIVEGSVVLLSGEPGIGKSTLLLQICQYVGENNKIMYVSGEESPSQIKLRANRIGVDTDNLFILSETKAEAIIPEINALNPQIVIIDSIQTMYDSELSSAPGSITQVKQSTMLLTALAKENGISVILVGHVNKDGAIAGPKVLEHMVDAVLYFEGDKQHAYRIIRAAKNRFGSTNEIGVFEMVEDGLAEVSNPSEMLLAQRPKGVSGSCAVCVIEGSRPIIAEIQALASPTVFPSPRRMAAGLDYNRVTLIIAVLEKRLGLRFATLDVYMNVAGGLKLDEPSSDLSTALALISTLKDKPIPDNLIAFGEIGLAGECRAVSGIDIRVNEARRLGFVTIAVPYKCVSKLKGKYTDVNIVPIRSVYELFGLLGE